MNLSAAIQKGTAHAAYCEDFLMSESLGEKSLLLAVLDGCSMGEDSHFASALYGKLLRKIAQEMSLESLRSPVSWQEEQPETVAREVLRRLFAEVKVARQQLALNWEELLTTVILWVHHFGAARSFVIVIGDGYVCCDGQVHELDQNNKPDYLAYHFDLPFDDWWAGQTQRFTFEQPQDLSIATDGVATFHPWPQPEDDASLPDPLAYLLVDAEFAEADNMLDRKLMYLRKAHQFHAIDDVAIIRVRFGA